MGQFSWGQFFKRVDFRGLFSGGSFPVAVFLLSSIPAYLINQWFSRQNGFLWIDNYVIQWLRVRIIRDRID